MQAGKLRLRALALVLTLLLPAALAVPSAAAEDAPIVNALGWYDYQQMVWDLSALAERFPELASVGSIGRSAEGRDIPLLRLGRGETTVLVCAAMHAREYETTSFVMAMAEQYCRGYASDGRAAGLSYRAILDAVTFLIVPQLNPDGVNIAMQGTDYALTRPELAALPITDGWPGNYFCWKANARGVDLNRNWPYLWNNRDLSPQPSSADYAGPEPLSEPETQAMMQLIQSSGFAGFISFHSAGNCVYWIDSSNSPALRERLYPTAKRLSDAAGYYLMPDEDVSRFGGYMISYCRAAYEAPCLTVELGAYAGRYPFTDYQGLQETLRRAGPLCLILADEAARLAAETPAVTARANRKQPR